MKLGTLRIRMPSGQSREFSVEQAAIGAGRASDNELVLDDISVSRRHARLTFEAGLMTVEDLGSANGSYIGSQRLVPNTPALVPAGESARLGDVELRFVPAEAPRPAAATPAAGAAAAGTDQATMVFGPEGQPSGTQPAPRATGLAPSPNRYGILRIKMPDGRQRGFGLDQPTITVGRSSDNQLAIDDISVSRRHARLSVESGRLMIEDLGSANGTFIGGQRLAPNNPGLVSEDQVVRLGDVELRYVPPRPVEAARSFAADAAAASAAQAAPAGPPVSVSLVGPAQPVSPGGVATAALTIQNRGAVVDELTVRVAGLPAAWVRLSKERVPLLPNAQESVTISFQPPRRAEAVASDHPFTISVISREHRTGVNVQGVLRVLPFQGFLMELQPVRSRRDFQVVAQNQGNAPVTYRLSGVDDEHALLFSFGQDTLSLQPGQTLDVPLQVLPKVMPRIGTSQTRTFNVLAEATDGSGAEVKAPGQLMIRPPIPIWLIPLVLILLLCLCIGGVWGYVSTCADLSAASGSALPLCPGLNKPVINVFTATPTQVDQGGSVVIAWDVSNAQKVEFLSPAPNTVPATGLQTFKVTANTTFTLRATNSSGSIEQSVDVIVKKSAPVIQTFTANPGVINPGQTNTKVILSWTVLGATSISIQGVPSQNFPATGSVEIPAPSANTTYTLVATNDAGTVKQDLTVVISSANCVVGNVAGGQKLPLRVGPGAGYDTVVGLDNGTQLDPIGRNSTADWIDVRAAGREGWVPANFVSCANVADLSVYPTIAPNQIPTLAPTATNTPVPPTDTPVPSGTPAPTKTPTPTFTPTATPTPVLASGGLVTYRVQQGGHTAIFLQGTNGGPIPLIQGKDDAEVLAYTAKNGGRFAIWALEGSAQKIYIVDQTGHAIGNAITGGWNAIVDADWSNDGQRLVVEATTGAAVGYYYYDANGNFLAQPSFP
jgi:pSer/pThr/pTyr-binding forkhead associated (FHA) protein